MVVPRFFQATSFVNIKSPRSRPHVNHCDPRYQLYGSQSWPDHRSEATPDGSSRLDRETNKRHDRNHASGNEEMAPELPEVDDLLGRIDAALGLLPCHIHSPSEEVSFILQTLCRIVARPRASVVARGTRVHLL